MRPVYYYVRTPENAVRSCWISANDTSGLLCTPTQKRTNRPAIIKETMSDEDLEKDFVLSTVETEPFFGKTQVLSFVREGDFFTTHEVSLRSNEISQNDLSRIKLS